MPPPSRTVLGIDASTQSLSAILLHSHTGDVLWSRSLAYRDDPRLLGFGFEHDTLIIPAREPGEAEQPPRLFIAALDALFSDLKAAGFDTAAIAAINTSGQQHGHVYLNAQAKASFARLHNPASANDSLLNTLSDSLAYGGAPIWKTANTAAEAAHIRATVGGKAASSNAPAATSRCASPPTPIANWPFVIRRPTPPPGTSCRSPASSPPFWPATAPFRSILATPAAPVS